MLRYRKIICAGNIDEPQATAVMPCFSTRDRSLSTGPEGFFQLIHTTNQSPCRPGAKASACRRLRIGGGKIEAEELSDLPLTTIQQLISFARSHHVQRVP